MIEIFLIQIQISILEKKKLQQRYFFTNFCEIFQETCFIENLSAITSARFNLCQMVCCLDFSLFYFILVDLKFSKLQNTKEFLLSIFSILLMSRFANIDWGIDKSSYDS